jgi:NADH:ubiquinone oxidoreductase subunit C
MIGIENRLFISLILALFHPYINKVDIEEDNSYRLYFELGSIYIIMQYLNLFINFRYKILSDITCVDFIGKKERFQLNYNLLSIENNSRIKVTIELKQNEIVSSLTNIFNGSN